MCTRSPRSFPGKKLKILRRDSPIKMTVLSFSWRRKKKTHNYNHGSRKYRISKIDNESIHQATKKVVKLNLECIEQVTPGELWMLRERKDT